MYFPSLFEEPDTVNAVPTGIFCRAPVSAELMVLLASLKVSELNSVAVKLIVLFTLSGSRKVIVGLASVADTTVVIVVLFTAPVRRITAPVDVAEVNCAMVVVSAFIAAVTLVAMCVKDCALVAAPPVPSPPTVKSLATTLYVRAPTPSTLTETTSPTP